MQTKRPRVSWVITELVATREKYYVVSITDVRSYYYEHTYTASLLTNKSYKNKLQMFVLHAVVKFHMAHFYANV